MSCFSSNAHCVVLSIPPPTSLPPFQYAVEVLDLVKRTLPVISMAAQCLKPPGSGITEDSTVYSDAKHLHYVSLETEHPYKQGTVYYYKVTAA